MAIQGLRDTSNFVADQRPKNWRETILLLYPNGKAPLTALTSLMKSEETNDPEFNWWDKKFPSQRMVMSANLTAGAGSIPVVDGAKAVREGHILLIEQTGEIVYCNADASSDTSISVSRAFSGTSAAAIADIGAAGVNPNIRVIGNVNEESSLPPTGVNYDPTKRFNYTQIFRNTLEMSRTAQKTRLRTGNQVKEAKRECLELHSIEMEKSFWWGKRHETTIKGKPARTTGGFLSFIDSNNIVANNGAAVDMETLEGWLERIFRFGSSEKMGFCGNMFLVGVQQAIRKNSQITIQSGIKEFGMNVSKLFCPFGELTLKSHPLFNQLTGGTTAATRYYGYNSACAILDANEIKYRNFVDADTKYQPKLEANGLDGMQSGYLTEAGIEVHHPETHFLITGVETGTADS
jgi:hypothetical protein